MTDAADLRHRNLAHARQVLAGDAFGAGPPLSDAAIEGITLAHMKGTILDVPRPGGFYRIRISDPTLSLEEINEVATRMAQDRVVEMIAVPQ